ncbi:hypothetical protein Goshw_027705 [Gossypium schwendimanii]|uniref:DUF4283 domain-containing protein n=1 Tax=Gossypium schwendimanii TaxID=34291 RepID=A0A7J9LYZ6_GOSSC|nr:hypothetical protein [Gossypium schwendimanii]
MERDLAGLSLDGEDEILEAMRSTIANLWHFVNGVHISDLGEKPFLFRFFNEMDMERVTSRAPWTFNNHLLMIHRLEEGNDSMKVPLILTNFWVQVHDVPSGFFSEPLARKLGDFIGKLLEYDSECLKRGDAKLLADGGLLGC